MSDIAALEYIRKLESRVSKLERQELSYWFVPLTTHLTSNLWDGDARSTTGKTLLDLSNIFGTPANIKAVLLHIIISDTASSADWGCRIILSPNSVNDSGLSAGCGGITNSSFSYEALVVPCDANGNIYYQIYATGALSMLVYLQIWGYWV
jgi:hypothetical protein